MAHDLQLGVSGGTQARPAACAARRVFASMVDQHHRCAGGRRQAAAVGQREAHVLAAVLVRAGRRLGVGVDNDQINAASGNDRCDQFADVFLLHQVRRRGDDADVEIRCVDVVVLGVGLEALANACAAFRCDVEDARLAHPQAAPLDAARNGRGERQRHERLARAAGAIQHDQIRLGQHCLDQPSARLPARHLSSGRHRELSGEALRRVNACGGRQGSDLLFDALGLGLELLHRHRPAGRLFGHLDHRGHRDLLLPDPLPPGEAVPLRLQGLFSGILSAQRRPLVPQDKAVVAALRLVMDGHAGADPLIAPHVRVEGIKQLLNVLEAQAKARLAPRHEIVAVFVLGCCAEPLEAQRLCRRRGRPDGVLQFEHLDMGQRVAGQRDEAVAAERLEAEDPGAGLALAVAERAAHESADALARRAVLAVAHADGIEDLLRHLT